MPMFAVLFEDHPDNAAAIRRDHMEHHLDFLQASQDFIRAAGPLRPAAGGTAGGLWVVEAENEMEVQRLVEADPFWSAGLRKSVCIFVWTQVFSDGSRLSHA